jgi:cytochrome c oxidase subunit 2
LDSANPEAKDDLVVLGELHVPVNRPVIVETSSKDVIHNFALPHMRAAQDSIPGHIIPLWFTPIKTGTYEIVCGQLCGLGHYAMKGTLVVDTPEDYQAWLKERAELAGSGAAPAPETVTPGTPGPTPGTIPEPGAPKVGDPMGSNPAATPGERRPNG